jgi:hypothetical protein
MNPSHNPPAWPREETVRQLEQFSVEVLQVVLLLLQIDNLSQNNESLPTG